MSKILVVLGPTASGKSELAVKIATWEVRHGKRSGIISADSRQVYRGMDIGSGKVNGKWVMRHGKRVFVYKGIPHHMIDVASPLRQYSVAQYQKAARDAISALLASGSIPIVCGGTGLYIDALLYDYPIPAVKPNPALRARLEKKSAEELFAELARRDPRRAETIDRFNKRRLVRALEIVRATNAPVPKMPLRRLNVFVPIRANGYKDARADTTPVDTAPEVLKIGLRPTDDVLKARIARRLLAWIRAGLLREVRGLHQNGLSWKRIESFGLVYRLSSRHVQRTISKKECIGRLDKELWRYAKRQMTWWKRDKEIRWVKSEREALVAAKRFLTKDSARITA